MSRLFGFKYKYSQEFLDQLAKEFGFEWTLVKPQLIDKDEISISPLPPPSGKLYYMNIKIK